MALGYPWKDCPWQVWHEGHEAFRLRALLVGDFSPGRVIRGHMVIERSGLPPANRMAAMTCETCGKVPRPEDVVVEDRTTGQRHYLDLFRGKRHRWPEHGFRGDRCWWCQSPRALLVDDGLCAQCVALRDGPLKPVKQPCPPFVPPVGPPGPPVDPPEGP